MYVYSIGSQLCGTHVRIADLTRGAAPSLVRCFHSLPRHSRLSALAFHIYADLLYYAESQTGAGRIYRIHMQTADHDQPQQARAPIADNTGAVGGTLPSVSYTHLTLPTILRV